MKVLVTGASGFVGKCLCHSLRERNIAVVAGVRYENPDFTKDVTQVPVGNIDSTTDWTCALNGVDTVVHSAARVHFLQEKASDPLGEYRKVNVDGTVHLAWQAVRQGVKRFVFISTIKVNGELTQPGQPFSADDCPNPQDFYALSKWEAEQSLVKIALETGLEVVIIRPPLIYGPEVKGNFRSLMLGVALGIPLPLGAVHNQRSLVALDNLIDLIIVCLSHPKAVNQIFLVADEEDLSTTELLKKIASSMGRTPRLISVPPKLLIWGGCLLGKETVSRRLLDSLQVDITKTRDLLGWKPPVSIDAGLKRCVKEMQVREKNVTFFLLRFFDISFSVIGLLLCLPIFIVIMLAGWFDTRSPLFFQERVGWQREPFNLVKFRTMKLDTASVASHLASPSSITRLGGFLRKTKLDELPQLWNVLKGEMSLVGPRPCLYNQEELIRERRDRGVFTVRPGITGLAQVNEIDMSTPRLLAETDAKMICEMSVKSYFKFILQTVTGKGAGDRVK